MEGIATVVSLTNKVMPVSKNVWTDVVLSNGLHWECPAEEAPAPDARYLITATLDLATPLPFDAPTDSVARTSHARHRHEESERHVVSAGAWGEGNQ